jgi:hypothetical protein
MWPLSRAVLALCANLIQAAGVSAPSFTDENMTEGMTEQEEDQVKWAANSLVIGP